jgi:hypothetical protein
MRLLIVKLLPLLILILILTLAHDHVLLHCLPCVHVTDHRLLIMPPLTYLRHVEITAI